VKIGDLNRSASAHLQGIHPRSEVTTYLSAIDRFVGAGEEFEVNLKLDDFKEKVLGGQWSLKMTGAKVISITAMDPSMNEDMWYATESEVRWAWNTQNPESVKELVNVKLMALKPGRISEMIAIDPTFMDPELYNENQEVYKLDLKWKTEDEEIQETGIQLHQNRPNPWMDETLIPFEIPDAGEVTFTITDALGNEIKTITKEFAAGKQQLKISNDDWAPGAYYYTIRFGDAQLTKKMLILNKR